MNGRKRLLGVISVTVTSLFLGGLPATALDSRPECQIRFDVVLATQHSAIEDARDFVIRDKESWCEFWDEVHAWIDPSPECPSDAIDFGKEVAIVSTLGPQPNSCYGNAITRIEYSERPDGPRRGGVFTVHVDDVVPEPSCLCLSVIVHPVYVVKVKEPVTVPDRHFTLPFAVANLSNSLIVSAATSSHFAETSSRNSASVQ